MGDYEEYITLRMRGDWAPDEWDEPDPARRPHIELSETRKSPNGKLAFELGVKFGYWPCLKAPFVAIALGFRRLDMWYGLPSKWPNKKPPTRSAECY